MTTEGDMMETGGDMYPTATTTIMGGTGTGTGTADSIEATAVHADTNTNNEAELYEEIREQDRYLPIANIARIMKNTLPENAKIAKESKETVQECVSEFISFITSEASDKCLQEKRKTINGDDLLFAMSTLGFDKYVEPLKEYLRKYRDTVKKPPKAGSGNTE
jgi:nuclear transcription Y subunit beta